VSLITQTVNGHNYEMACDDGQEAHLRKLAAYVDEKVRGLAESVGPAGEKRVLVMTSLLIADELFEAYQQVRALSDGASEQDQAAAVVESCTQRIEAIAARLAGA